MWSATLANIQASLNLYGYSSLLVLGNIGNLLIAIAFSRHRQNACSNYLLVAAIMNNLYLTLHGFAQLFPRPFDGATADALVLCKLRLYLNNVFGQVAKTMIIFACVDRYLITSSRAHFRRFSTMKRSKRLILASILFWLVGCSHIGVMARVNLGQCGVYGTYALVYTSYVIAVAGLIPPLVLIVFAGLTYRNMRNMRARISSTASPANASTSLRRRDRELLVLVACELVLYVITTTPFPVMLAEFNISQLLIPTKSLLHLQIESFILYATLLLLFVNNAAPFYVYLVVSKSFRQESIQIIKNLYWKLRRRPPVLPVHLAFTASHPFDPHAARV